jgi:ribosome biogenesis GTPase
MDLVVCVCSAETPPFRPRFIDRVIACARGVDVMIVMNKCDILLTEDEHERFRLFSDLGYRTMAVSAKTGENMDLLSQTLAGSTVAFVGQSGVGKSTLINRLLGSDGKQRIGEVSQKFNRGRHTTNHSLMLDGPGFVVVDTPGVREILVPHGDPHMIADSFPEFRAVANLCEYDGCLHDQEPGCKVKELVEDGNIHFDRYESYLRMLASLDERVPQWLSESYLESGKAVTTSKSGKFQRKNKLMDSRDGVGWTVMDHVEEDS